MIDDFDYTVLGIETRDMIVYESLQLLENGSLRAIAEETGLNRGTVYEIIKKLTGLGLVTFTVSGQRKRYSAAAPDTFLALIRERQEQLRQAEKAAEAYVEHFRSIAHIAAVGNVASFYEGDEGVAAILRDVLQTVRGLDSKTYHVISSRAVSEFLYNNFPNFSRQRIKERIFVRVLAIGPAGEEVVQAERKQLLQNYAQSARGYTIIYGNKTALISLNGQNVPFGIVIDHAGIADMQRLLFEHLWNTTK